MILPIYSNFHSFLLVFAYGGYNQLSKHLKPLSQSANGGTWKFLWKCTWRSQGENWILSFRLC